jgi:hypothetical protein
MNQMKLRKYSECAKQISSYRPFWQKLIKICHHKGNGVRPEIRTYNVTKEHELLQCDVWWFRGGPPMFRRGLTYPPAEPNIIQTNI